MRTRQLKRWCDECKMMVFSLGHEHLGRTEGPAHPNGVGVTENADARRASELACDHVAVARLNALNEGERIFEDKLKSAVERLNK